MNIFISDVFKMELLNGELIYGLCVKTCKFDFGSNLYYLDLNDLCLKRVNSVDVRCLSLVSSLKTCVFKMNRFISYLPNNRKEAFLEECSFIVKNHKNGKTYNSTKNKSLISITEFLDVDVLTASMLFNYKHVFPRYCRFVSFCLDTGSLNTSNIEIFKFQNFLNCDYRLSDSYSEFREKFLKDDDDEFASNSVDELVVV